MKHFNGFWANNLSQEHFLLILPMLLMALTLTSPSPARANAASETRAATSVAAYNMWQGRQNVLVDDDNYATTNLSNTGTSQYIY